MNYYLILACPLFAYMSLWFAISLIQNRNDVADVAWGLRLPWHIHLRNPGKAEDYRYLAWRKQWGKWFYVRPYLQVYLLQGFSLFLIVSPVLAINRSPGSSTHKTP